MRQYVFQKYVDSSAEGERKRGEKVEEKPLNPPITGAIIFNKRLFIQKLRWHIGGRSPQAAIKYKTKMFKPTYHRHPDYYRENI